MSECFTRASVEPDDNVENAAYESCFDHTRETKRTFKIKVTEYDPQTGRRIREREVLQEGKDYVFVPANVQAQQFWLANRRKDKWAFKPEAEAKEDEGGGVIMIPDVGKGEKTSDKSDKAAKDG